MLILQLGRKDENLYSKGIYHKQGPAFHEYANWSIIKLLLRFCNNSYAIVYTTTAKISGTRLFVDIIGLIDVVVVDPTLMSCSWIVKPLKQQSSMTPSPLDLRGRGQNTQTRCPSVSRPRRHLKKKKLCTEHPDKTKFSECICQSIKLFQTRLSF